MTQEIGSRDWPEFWRRFQDQNRGSLLSIQTVDEGGHRLEVARETPLRNLSWDGNGCSDVLVFELGRPGQSPICHQIVQPIHVKIRSDPAGHKKLEIKAESGSSLIEFHSGKVGEMLAGLRLV